MSKQNFEERLDKILGELRELILSTQNDPSDDILDAFTYFNTPFNTGGIVPKEDDIDYANLLRDDEHEENIDKVYHNNNPLEGFEVVEGRFYIGNTYIGIGKMTIPIIKVD